MNCNRFRFLIQQRFDTEISPQDDRALLMHLETCESCQKFHHQVQQVILAAEELPIQDDLLPIKLESLARRIMEQLPQPKQNLIDTVRGFLQNLGAKKNGSEKFANNAAKPQKSAPKQPSMFPHVNRNQPAVDLDEEFPGKKVSDEQLQEMRANSGKLRAMAAKGYQDMPASESRELQSTTRPLSEKFGPRQALNNALSEEQPLNLADAIRRKRSESQRQSHDPQGMQEEAAKSDVDLWGGSTSFPGAHPQPPGANNLNQNSPYGAPPSGAPPVRPPAMGGSLQPESGPTAGSGGPSVLGAWGKPSPIDTTQWGVTSPGIPAVNPNQAAETTLQADDDQLGTSPDTGLGAFFSQAPKTANGPWNNPWGTTENKAAPDPNSWPNAPPAQPIEQNPAWPATAKGWEAVAKGPGGPGAQTAPSDPFGTPNHEPPPRRPPSSAWGEPEQAPVKPAGGPPGWPENPPTPNWPQSTGKGADWGNAWDGASTTAPQNQQAGGNPWDNAISQSAQKQPPIGSWTETGASGAWPSSSAPDRPDTTGGANPWDNPVPAKQPELPNQAAPMNPMDDNQAVTTSGSFKKTNWSVEAEQIETGTWQAFYPMDSLGTPSARANWDKGGNKPGPAPGPQPAQPGPTGLPDDLNNDWDVPIQEKLARQRIADFDANQNAGAPKALPPKPAGFSAPPLDPWTKPAQESFPVPPQSEFKPGEPESPPAWAPQEATVPLEKQSPPRQEEPKPKQTFDFATQSLAGLANSVMDKLGSMLGDRHSKPIISEPAKAEKPPEKAWEAPAPDLWSPSDAPAKSAPGLSSFGESSQPLPGLQGASGFGSVQPTPFGQSAAPPPIPATQPGNAPPYMPPQPAQTGAHPYSIQAETGALPSYATSFPQPESDVKEAAGSVDPTSGLRAPKISPVVSKKAGTSPLGEAQSDIAAEPPVQRIVPPPATNEGPTALPWPQSSASPDRSPSQIGLPALPSQADRSPSQLGIPAIPPVPVDRSPSQASIPAISPIPVDRSPSQTSIPAIPPIPVDRSPSQASIPTVQAPLPVDRSPSQSSIPVVQPPMPVDRSPSQSGAPVVPPSNPIDRSPSQGRLPVTPGFAPPDRAPSLPPPAMPATPDRSPSQPKVPVFEVPTSPAPVPSPPPAAAEKPSVASAKDKGLFAPLNDKDIDKLFSDNLGVNELANPTAPPTKPSSPAPNAIPSAQPWSMPAGNIQTPGSGTPALPSEPAPLPSWSPQSTPAPKAPTPAPQNPSSPPGFWAPPGQSEAKPEPAAPPMPAQPAAPAGEVSKFGQPGVNPAGEPERLFSLDPSIIDKIFTDHLGVSEQVMAKMPKNSINETVKAISDAAQQVPKIEGLGRLDARVDAATESGSGRIASIGKFLLDGKDLEKIGKITSSDPSDTKMRILTPEGAAELNSILQHVGGHPGVVGSVIIGHDGLLIVNNMPQDMDAEYFGVMAYTLYMSTTHATAKMGSQRVEQIVSKTPLGYLVIANFGNGLLVTASDVQHIETLIPLLRSITQLVAP